MSPDAEPKEALLDELSLGLVMVDPEDLISLGEILGKIEAVITAFTGGAQEGSVVLSGMQKALEAIILEQVQDKNQVMGLIGQGASLLQEMVRNKEGSPAQKVDISGYLEALKAEAGVRLTLPESPVPAPSLAPPEAAPAAPAPPETTQAVDISDYNVSEDKDLFFGFITESLEHIESIEVNIISLEQDPEDQDTINAIFRPFHTIKGVSGFLNLRQIHGLTHQVENLLDDARHERLKISPPVIDVILDAVDVLKKMIQGVKSWLETGGSVEADYDVEALLLRVAAIQQGDVPEPAQAGPSGYSGRKLGEILVDQDLISESELESILEEQERGRLLKLGQILVEQGIISEADLEQALSLQMESGDKRLGEILVETGKADPESISQALREQEAQREQKLGEILIREGQADAREVTSALREQKKAVEAGQPASQTVKVDTLKLDNLVNLVGELVIAQSLVKSNNNINGLKDQKLLRDLSHLTRITSEIQLTAMSMRMVPIRQTFQKMIRLVRDLSHKSGKQVSLSMSGEDTEIDRNMVEAIYDPLVHMVRNSVDHGVELPEVRRQSGKPAEGWLHLRAFHQGGNVVIQIEDDGQGLNKEKILKKALERGLIRPEDELTEAQTFSLIFQPGFSTADKVTDVSGRGVGMDVVKKAIERLRGKTEIDSKSGRGSTITIRLPLTLAIIDGIIVRLGEHRYILPTVAIRESFRPGPGDYYTVQGQGEMIKVRENLLPLVRLNQVLGAQGAQTDPTQALVVVVENEGDRRCVMVDEVLGKQEVVIKSLGERLKYVRALAGGSILGDGRVGLILDVVGLFEISDGLAGGVPRAAAPEIDSDWEKDQDWGMGPT